MNNFLSENSNIIKFKNMFQKVNEKESYSILRYLFNWNTTENTVQKSIGCSELSEKVKKAVMHGTKFHETLGVLNAENF